MWLFWHNLGQAYILHKKIRRPIVQCASVFCTCVLKYNDAFCVPRRTNYETSDMQTCVLVCGLYNRNNVLWQVRTNWMKTPVDLNITIEYNQPWIYAFLGFLTLEDGTDRLSRNVGNDSPIAQRSAVLNPQSVVAIQRKHIGMITKRALRKYYVMPTLPSLFQNYTINCWLLTPSARFQPTRRDGEEESNQRRCC
jgi:hypothetical protein